MATLPDTGRYLVLKPGEYYYRVRYQRARNRAQRDELFRSLARDHEQLRNWVRDTFGVNPPKWECTGMEAIAKPHLTRPPLRVVPDGVPAAEDRSGCLIPWASQAALGA